MSTPRAVAVTGRPLSRPTLTRQLEDALRQDIILGVLRPGDVLKTGELSLWYEVSQTPIREALARLAAEGFVDLRSQRSARVSDLSMQDLDDVYELRIILEPLALRRSMLSPPSGWHQELNTAMLRLESLTGIEGRAMADQSSEWSHAHKLFHRLLVENCGSSHLLRTVLMLYDHSERYRMASRNMGGERRHSLKEHQEILAKATDGDVESAAYALAQHLRETVRLLHVAANAPHDNDRARVSHG